MEGLWFCIKIILRHQHHLLVWGWVCLCVCVWGNMHACLCACVRVLEVMFMHACVRHSQPPALSASPGRRRSPPASAWWCRWSGPARRAPCGSGRPPWARSLHNTREGPRFTNGRITHTHTRSLRNSSWPVEGRLHNSSPLNLTQALKWDAKISSLESRPVRTSCMILIYTLCFCNCNSQLASAPRAEVKLEK